MSTIEQRLADMRDRSEKATAGPWTHEPWGGQNQNGDYAGGNVFTPLGDHLVTEISDDDGSFIAHARTDLDDLRGAVEDVLALHRPSEPIQGRRRVVGPRGGTKVERFTYRVCIGEEAPDEYPTEWPCPTVAAITKRLGGA
jgi:hypothetical protein